MTKQEVKELVINAFKKLQDTSEDTFDGNVLNRDLNNDLGLDSLDGVEVMMNIEQAVTKKTGEKFTIDDDVFASSPKLTIAEIIDYVYDRVETTNVHNQFKKKREKQNKKK